jgi:hypothetical protein
MYTNSACLLLRLSLIAGLTPLSIISTMRAASPKDIKGTYSSWRRVSCRQKCVLHHRPKGVRQWRKHSCVTRRDLLLDANRGQIVIRRERAHGFADVGLNVVGHLNLADIGAERFAPSANVGLMEMVVVRTRQSEGQTQQSEHFAFETGYNSMGSVLYPV